MYTFEKHNDADSLPESDNFALMPKVQIHIGKKIKEVLDKMPISVVDFAKSINLTRNGAYKVFEKETIDTGQLQTISKVLNHDFFNYYEQGSTSAKESKPDYGYATKSEVADLAHAILKLTKAVERIEEQLPKKKSVAKKVTKEEIKSTVLEVTICDFQSINASPNKNICQVFKTRQV